MTRTRLLILFSLATVVCMTTFTALVYHGHVKSANQLDLNYLELYVDLINDKRQRGIKGKKLPLPEHVLDNNTYQIIVVDKKGNKEIWLKSYPWFSSIIKTFPFTELTSVTEKKGHVDIGSEDVHWTRLGLKYPDASIFFLHLESDHWRSFSKVFGIPIIILGILIFWAAIWSAIILANLFNRLQSKNELLQSQAMEICQARDQAYAAAQAKSRFLANISHELRTPLTAILGFSENMLDSNEVCSNQSVPLHTIIRNGNHLLHIINELLDLSKIEENKLQIECINFSPVQLLQDVELLMHQQAEDKGLEFRINYSWPLPASIRNDPFRTKQVLINLCSNAIKFTSHGYVHINVSCHSHDELLNIDIIDTGIGIAPEQHNRIFQAFDQADISTTRQYGGTGLGLSLTKRLVELMGGSIILASEQGKGSRFTLTIPTGSLANTDFISDLSTHKLQTTSEDKPNYTLLKGKVLVADDAPDNRLLLSALLEKFGLQATVVENGQLALDTLSSREFDLILLDIQMPVLDGLQTLKKLQDMNYDKPVIALTANTLVEDRKMYQEAGFTDFISKPIRFKILNRILAMYLETA